MSKSTKIAEKGSEASKRDKGVISAKRSKSSKSSKSKKSGDSSKSLKQGKNGTTPVLIATSAAGLGPELPKKSDEVAVESVMQLNKRRVNKAKVNRQKRKHNMMPDEAMGLEGPRGAMLVKRYGHSQTMISFLKDIACLRKPNVRCVLKRPRAIATAEGKTSRNTAQAGPPQPVRETPDKIVEMSERAGVPVLLFASNTKKNPLLLSLARVANGQVLDLHEFTLIENSYRSMADSEAALRSVFKCAQSAVTANETLSFPSFRPNGRTVVLTQGISLDILPHGLLMRNSLLDLFTGCHQGSNKVAPVGIDRVVTITCTQDEQSRVFLRFLVSHLKLEHSTNNNIVQLTELGPSFTLLYRGSPIVIADKKIMDAAFAQVTSLTKPKKETNLSQLPSKPGELRKRIHINPQKLSELHTVHGH